MLTGTDYAWVWVCYLAAALLVLLSLWQMTARLPAWLRDPFCAIVMVVLLLPTVVDPARALYAPALFVTAFELVAAQDGGVGVVLGVRLLLSAMLAAVAAWLLRLLWYWLFGRRRSRRGKAVS